MVWIREFLTFSSHDFMGNLGNVCRILEGKNKSLLFKKFEFWNLIRCQFTLPKVPAAFSWDNEQVCFSFHFFLSVTSFWYFLIGANFFLRLHITVWFCFIEMQASVHSLGVGYTRCSSRKTDSLEFAFFLQKKKKCLMFLSIHPRRSELKKDIELSSKLTRLVPISRFCSSLYSSYDRRDLCSLDFLFSPSEISRTFAGFWREKTNFLFEIIIQKTEFWN